MSLVEQQPIQVALLGDSESGQPVPNSNTGGKLRRAATVAIGCAVAFGCGVAVAQPNHIMDPTLLNHTMDPTLLYGASPIILRTPQCDSSNGDVHSGDAPNVELVASGDIPFTVAGSPIAGPLIVSATGGDGKCVNSVSLDGNHISGPTWFDKPCTSDTPSAATPKCVSSIAGTGQLKIGFRQCANSPYGNSGGKVHAAFLFNGATSWGSGPLAGTLTLTMEYNDGFCSEGITVNGQLINSEKFWFDKACVGFGYGLYQGASSCVTTKMFRVR